MAKFVRIPKRGDIAANDLVTRKTMYIPREQYKAADIEGTHEVIGIVAGIIGREAIIVHPDCGTTAKWTNRLWWYCTGYTLDGKSHTITFKLRFASNSYASNITKTITYSATTLSALISALNAAFAGDDDFKAQEWYADEWHVSENEVKLRISCDNVDWSLSQFNYSSDGLTMGVCMPEIPVYAYMRKKNGDYNGLNAISSMARALIYYGNSTGTTVDEGGCTSIQESVKQKYPINLTTWNGEFCAPLRAIYGEGTEGWKRFMKSCLPVTPTDYGYMGIHDGKSICKPLAQITGRKMSSADSVQSMAAFAKPYNIMGNTFSKGDFWLPTAEECSVILSGDNDSTDPLNIGLLAIGGRTIPNTVNLWLCLKYSEERGALIANNMKGIFSYEDWCFSSAVVPVSRTII